MHNHFWRHTALALTISGLLLTAAHAQKTPTSNDNQMTKPAIVERDPFLNQLQPSRVIRFCRPLTKGSDPFSSERQEHKVEGPPSDLSVLEAPTPEIDTSGLQVTGIVGQGQNRQAIMIDGTSTKIIQTGQKLSDFRVASIDESSVTLSQAGQRYRIPLASEY